MVIRNNSGEILVASVGLFDHTGTKLLLGLRSGVGKWNCPGGHFEADETPVRAAVRELVEETGIKPVSIEYMGERSVIGPEGPHHEIRVFSFRAIAPIGAEARTDLDPDNETDRWEWVDITKGLPEIYANNLYNIQDITLKMLGFQDGPMRKFEIPPQLKSLRKAEGIKPKKQYYTGVTHSPISAEDFTAKWTEILNQFPDDKQAQASALSVFTTQRQKEYLAQHIEKYGIPYFYEKFLSPRHIGTVMHVQSALELFVDHDNIVKNYAEKIGKPPEDLTEEDMKECFWGDGENGRNAVNISWPRKMLSLPSEDGQTDLSVSSGSDNSILLPRFISSMNNNHTTDIDKNIAIHNELSQYAKNYLDEWTNPDNVEFAKGFYCSVLQNPTSATPIKEREDCSRFTEKLRAFGGDVLALRKSMDRDFSFKELGYITSVIAYRRGTVELDTTTPEGQELYNRIKPLIASKLTLATLNKPAVNKYSDFYDFDVLNKYAYLSKPDTAINAAVKDSRNWGLECNDAYLKYKVKPEKILDMIDLDLENPDSRKDLYQYTSSLSTLIENDTFNLFKKVKSIKEEVNLPKFINEICHRFNSALESDNFLFGADHESVLDIITDGLLPQIDNQHLPEVLGNLFNVYKNFTLKEPLVESYDHDYSSPQFILNLEHYQPNDSSPILKDEALKNKIYAAWNTPNRNFKFHPHNYNFILKDSLIGKIIHSSPEIKAHFTSNLLSDLQKWHQSETLNLVADHAEAEDFKSIDATVGRFVNEFQETYGMDMSEITDSNFYQGLINNYTANGNKINTYEGAELIKPLKLSRVNQLYEAGNVDLNTVIQHHYRVHNEGSPVSPIESGIILNHLAEEITKNGSKINNLLKNSQLAFTSLVENGQNTDGFKNFVDSFMRGPVLDNVIQVFDNMYERSPRNQKIFDEITNRANFWPDVIAGVTGTPEEQFGRIQNINSFIANKHIPINHDVVIQLLNQPIVQNNNRLIQSVLYSTGAQGVRFSNEQKNSIYQKAKTIGYDPITIGLPEYWDFKPPLEEVLSRKDNMFGDVVEFRNNFGLVAKYYPEVAYPLLKQFKQSADPLVFNTVIDNWFSLGVNTDNKVKLFGNLIDDPEIDDKFKYILSLSLGRMVIRDADDSEDLTNAIAGIFKISEDQFNKSGDSDIYKQAVNFVHERTNSFRSSYRDISLPENLFELAPNVTRHEENKTALFDNKVRQLAETINNETGLSTKPIAIGNLFMSEVPLDNEYKYSPENIEKYITDHGFKPPQNQSEKNNRIRNIKIAAAQMNDFIKDREDPVDQHDIYNFGNFIYSNLLNADKTNERVESIRNRLYIDTNPDKLHKVHAMVRVGLQKLRKIRDLILARDPVKKSVSPKLLPPGDWSVGRLPNGDISADQIDKYIEQQPATRVNVSATTWEGAQRHNDEASKVFQVNISTDIMNKLKAAGVYDTWKNIVKAGKMSSHPVTDTTYGWVRYTGDKEGGYFIDEIQTDLGKDYVRMVTNEAKEKYKTDDENHPDVKAAVESVKEKFPPEHTKIINQIMFPGGGTNIFHEAFLQHLRDRGEHETPVHMQHSDLKRHISLSRPDEAVPAHMLRTYKEIPPKMGYEPSSYGKLPTENNSKFKDKPTWSGKVRKTEDEI